MEYRKKANLLGSGDDGRSLSGLDDETHWRATVAEAYQPRRTMAERGDARAD